jgi:hypothetical protein
MKYVIDEQAEIDRVRQKIQLKQYYKRLKAGSIVFEDITKDNQVLLMKYYPNCYVGLCLKYL